MAYLLQVHETALARMGLVNGLHRDTAPFAFVLQHVDKSTVGYRLEVLIVPRAHGRPLFPTVVLPDDEHRDVLTHEEVDDSLRCLVHVVVDLVVPLVREPPRPVARTVAGGLVQLLLLGCQLLVVELIDAFQRASADDERGDALLGRGDRGEVLHTEVETRVGAVGREFLYVRDGVGHHYLVLVLLRNHTDTVDGIEVLDFRVELDVNLTEFNLVGLLEDLLGDDPRGVTGDVPAVFLGLVLRLVNLRSLGEFPFLLGLEEAEKGFPFRLYHADSLLRHVARDGLEAVLVPHDIVEVVQHIVGPSPVPVLLDKVEGAVADVLRGEANAFALAVHRRGPRHDMCLCQLHLQSVSVYKYSINVKKVNDFFHINFFNIFAMLLHPFSGK